MNKYGGTAFSSWGYSWDKESGSEIEDTQLGVSMKGFSTAIFFMSEFFGSTRKKKESTLETVSGIVVGHGLLQLYRRRPWAVAADQRLPWAAVVAGLTRTCCSAAASCC